MESKVQLKESSFIVPSEVTPTDGLWLSPIDLRYARRGHTPVVYIYRATANVAAFFDVARLKKALAKALVAFYPLAGRLGVNSDGRITIKCNGEGVLFVVVDSELTVDDFDFKPSAELRRIFVPRIEPSSIVMAIQVTFLKCGGVAIGIATHHSAVDAMSAFHFMQTWSSFSMDGNGAVVEVPCHDRTLLRPRSPPFVYPDALAVLFPKLTFYEPSESTATGVFTISEDQVATLKSYCNGASTFCSVSALVWRCACVARRLPPDAWARIIFPANIRRRLRPPLPDRYFGNALVWLGTTCVVREIASESISLASTAGRIASVIARIDDEMVRSAIDYLEQTEIDSRPLKGIMPETDIWITSWLGMPMYDADFGWGKPWLMSRAESVRGGFVYLMNDGPQGGNRGVRVVMCMEASNLKMFESLLYADIANAAKP